MKRVILPGAVFLSFSLLALYVFSSRTAAKGASIPYPLQVDPAAYTVEETEPMSRKGNNAFSFRIHNDIPRKPDMYGRYFPVTDFIRKFRPFHLSNPLMSWKWVLDNIDYADDYQKFKRKDVWQFAQTTYTLKEGDCEDVSILLCDWLRSQGYDAKVAVGEYAASGWHAWVVLNHEQNTFILECTGGSSLYSRPLLPLKKKLISRYRPLGLFNEKKFWVFSAPE